MTLKAASDSSSSMDRPNTTPDFLGSRQWMRSFTVEVEGGGEADVGVLTENLNNYTNNNNTTERPLNSGVINHKCVT